MGRMTVLRYEIQDFRIHNVAVCHVHEGAALIHIDEIKNPDPNKHQFDVFFWFHCDTSARTERRRFWMVKDGEDLSALGEDGAFSHVGSWRSVSGHIWQHVYEITHLTHFDPPRRLGYHPDPYRGPRVRRRQYPTPQRVAPVSRNDGGEEVMPKKET